MSQVYKLSSDGSQKMSSVSKFVQQALQVLLLDELVYQELKSMHYLFGRYIHVIFKPHKLQILRVTRNRFVQYVKMCLLLTIHS